MDALGTKYNEIMVRDQEQGEPSNLAIWVEWDIGINGWLHVLTSHFDSKEQKRQNYANLLQKVRRLLYAMVATF